MLLLYVVLTILFIEQRFFENILTWLLFLRRRLFNVQLLFENLCCRNILKLY